MNRFKGLPSLIVIIAVVWLLLRLAHVLIPTVRPDVLAGPFELESLREIEEVTEFMPMVPVYHPASLGDQPIRIVAERRPRRAVTILWRDERLLEMIELPVETSPEIPVDAESLDAMPGWWFWKRGGTMHMAGPSGAVHVSLKTNLSREDVIRIASSLVPLNEVR